MVVPASVSSLEALGLIGTLACFDNATQNVLTPLAEAASAERQDYIITLLHSAEAAVRQQTRQIRAAYGDGPSERAGRGGGILAAEACLACAIIEK